MIKKYWIEIVVSLGMTLMLAFSFSSSAPPQATPTAAARRLREAYQPISADQPFLAAEFKPGATQGKSWAVRIWSDGRVVSQVGGRESNSTLTAAQVKGLLDRLRQEDLLQLLGKSGGAPTESQELILRPRLTGGEGQVSLPYGPEAKNSHEGRRFLRVWADVLTEIPSPNGEKPIDYL